MQKTLDTGLGHVFQSEAKAGFGMKGEASGNVLNLVEIRLDCDQDTLLVTAKPAGPTCHTGEDTCWGEENTSDKLLFLRHLESIIHQRKTASAVPTSYTASLFEKGINKIAQKWERSENW